jgi:hypothetical protein
MPSGALRAQRHLPDHGRHQLLLQVAIEAAREVDHGNGFER